MRDEQCVGFLKWALPHLQMRWEGFRRVHAQVCKRIARRLRELDIPTAAAYRDYLAREPGEWAYLDSLCYVTVSRFYRETALFGYLADNVLPELLQRAGARGDDTLRVWSAGCARGEEPYSLALLWIFTSLMRRTGLSLDILATDLNKGLLDQARVACYGWSSVKNLPDDWREHGFDKQGDMFCLKPIYRRLVRFRSQDIRRTIPTGPFDLILCRNLVFTYYNVPLQQERLEDVLEVLRPGGALVLGIRERLPPQHGGAAVPLTPWSQRLRIYRKYSEDTPRGF